MRSYELSRHRQRQLQVCPQLLHHDVGIYIPGNIQGDGVAARTHSRLNNLVTRCAPRLDLRNDRLPSQLRQVGGSKGKKRQMILAQNKVCRPDTPVVSLQKECLRANLNQRWKNDTQPIKET